MRFRSTQTITLHKFAAGHRYLSYIAPDSTEQEEMLRRVESPDYDASVAFEIDRAKAQGLFMAARHDQYENFEKGALAKNNAMGKGNIRPALRPLERPETIVQDNLPRVLDWQPLENEGGRFRRVGRNPKPKILLPFKRSGPVAILLVLAHPDPRSLENLALTINGAPFGAKMSPPYRGHDGWEATARINARLRPDDYSVIELQLTEAQRMRQGQVGIGVGEIVLAPRRLRDRARAHFGRIIRALLPSR